MNHYFSLNMTDWHEVITWLQKAATITASICSGIIAIWHYSERSDRPLGHPDLLGITLTSVFHLLWKGASLTKIPNLQYFLWLGEVQVKKTITLFIYFFKTITLKNEGAVGEIQFEKTSFNSDISKKGSRERKHYWVRSKLEYAAPSQAFG